MLPEAKLLPKNVQLPHGPPQMSAGFTEYDKVIHETLVLQLCLRAEKLIDQKKLKACHDLSMHIVHILRKLADQQQYAALLDSCQEFWIENSDPAALPLLALAHAHLGQKQPAEEICAQAMSRKSELDGDSLIDLAAVLIVMQRTDEAVDLLQEALAQQPNHGLALARLGFCRMVQGQLEVAAELFSRSAELEPERIPVLNNLAYVHLQQGQHEAARQVLDRALATLARIAQDLPDDVAKQHLQLLHGMRLRVWVEAEQLAEAEQWLEEQMATLAEETAVHWLVEYARLLAGRDNHAQAGEILREGLRRFSENIALCRQLAELAQLQGHFMQAVHMLQRALKWDEENIGLWVQLSSASLHRFEQKARQAAKKAVELAEGLQKDDDHPPHLISIRLAQAHNALAIVESHEQNFEQAEQLFRTILAEHENFIPALQGLGQQLMQQGRIDEALELFERVRQIDPVKGYSSLINARRFPDDLETLDKLEKAARQPSLEGSVRAGILFQLAAAWEKRGEYDRAFAFAGQANEASRKFLPYDGKAHRNQCARIRARFSRSLYEHRPDCGVESTLPVYVLGMPRSGTTLVEQILSGHSEIFGAGELGVIPQVAQGLNRWERHVGSGRRYPDCVDDLIPYVSAGIANNVLEELQDYAPEAKHIVDKLPHNFENIGLIKFLFPLAKIISVRRDPRDIAISNYFTDYQAKHGGMGFAYDLADIGEQLADHNLLMHHWHQVFPGEILELNYEDVVDDLEGSARRMLDYIGVEWESQVLKFNELDRPVNTASVWQVRQPIYKTSKEKWKRYEKYLHPLIKGTNALIRPDPVEMLSLPVPGFLTDGVDLYRKGDLDGAELSFKKMLHHNPEHAACTYMVGLIYFHKGHLTEGIELVKKALDKAPWHREWRDNLAKAYGQTGEHEKAAELKARYERKKVHEEEGWQDEEALAGLEAQFGG